MPCGHHAQSRFADRRSGGAAHAGADGHGNGRLRTGTRTTTPTADALSGGAAGSNSA